MSPEIGVGDVVFSKKIEAVGVGDVISFRKNGSTITHRVVEIVIEDGEEKYKTKGDYNNTEDSGLVTKDEIEGTVIYRIGNLGNILMFLKTKEGMIGLALIVAIIYNQGRIADKKRKERKMKRKLYELQIKKEELENE